MGKTTFMINLFRTYYQKLGPKKYNVALFPLGAPYTDNAINQLASAANTVLLLDALDEDALAIRDYEARLTDLLERTYHFKKVVISCRTQFFPSEENEPHDTNIELWGPNRGTFKFRKIYVSPFTDSDVKKYLLKKFTIFKPTKILKAYKLVNQNHFLMVRPFLLSYINEIIHINKVGEYSYKVYELLVEKWIDREAFKVENSRREQFKKQLYSFSRNLSINLYHNQVNRKGLFISIREINEFAIANNIDLSELELRGKSLLNRNRENYKFAHKSILEYFISLELFENKLFFNTFQFEGMDQAKSFYRQQCADKAFSNNLQLLTTDIDKQKSILFEVISRKFSIDYKSIRSIAELSTLKEITLLNPDTFDEKFFEGMIFIEHINILITSSSSLKHISKAPVLKSITVLNSNKVFRVALFDFCRNTNSDNVSIIHSSLQDCLSTIYGTKSDSYGSWSSYISPDKNTTLIKSVSELIETYFSINYKDIIKRALIQPVSIREIKYDADEANLKNEFTVLIKKYFEDYHSYFKQKSL